MYFVMSFKPIYAFKIIEGVKDCEVRTYFGDLAPDDVVLIYASSPTKAFIGEFVVNEVFTGYINDVIEYLSNYCLMFDEDNWRFVREHYVGSRRRLVVIHVGEVTRYSQPVPLSSVRSVIPNFMPPMSYVKVSEDFVRLIRSLGLTS